MALGDDALWDKCGVETIDSCVGDPLAVVDPTEGCSAVYSIVGYRFCCECFCTAPLINPWIISNILHDP